MGTRLGAPTALGLHVALSREISAPAAARAALREWCDDARLDPNRAEAILLLASELVANAVRYEPGTEASVLLEASHDEDMVRVSVTDTRIDLIPKRRVETYLGGSHAPYIINELAVSWGIDDLGGTRAWFEL